MQIIINIDDDIAQGIIDGENDAPRNIVRAFQVTIADAIKNGTPIPEDATNGDVIKAMFPNASNSKLDLVDVLKNAKSWWNALYKAESEETK